jgi:predicted transcriptional regulator
MTPTLKDFIKGLSGTKAPGPSASFTVFHIFYTLELMSQKTMGRNKLAKELNVGEGAIRTIISRLVEAGLIVTSKEGCNLTAKGKDVWRQFEEAFPQRTEVPKTELTTSDYNYAFLVKNRGSKVKSGIDQRDAAIVAGAKRAVVIVENKGHLRIESVSENIDEEFPKATEKILKDIEPEENDVIVIAGGETPLRAKRGAFAAAFTLLEGEKKMH